VAGSAIFLTRTRDNIPPVMRWHVARNRALQREVLSLTIDILNVPYVDDEQRIEVMQRARDTGTVSRNTVLWSTRISRICCKG
jgi:KUP system potassium uptake protein